MAIMIGEMCSDAVGEVGLKPLCIPGFSSGSICMTTSLLSTEPGRVTSVWPAMFMLTTRWLARLRHRNDGVLMGTPATLAIQSLYADSRRKRLGKLMLPQPLPGSDMPITEYTGPLLDCNSKVHIESQQEREEWDREQE